MDKGITSKYIKKTASEKRDFKCCKSDVYNRYLTKQKHEGITMDNGITSITSDTENDIANSVYAK